MITTKKVKAGKLHVDFAGSANFSKVGKLPTLQDKFGQGWNGIFILGENGSWGPTLDGQDRLWGSVVDNSQLIKPFSFINDKIRNFYTTGQEYWQTKGILGTEHKNGAVVLFELNNGSIHCLEGKKIGMG